MDVAAVTVRGTRTTPSWPITIPIPADAASMLHTTLLGAKPVVVISAWRPICVPAATLASVGVTVTAVTVLSTVVKATALWNGLAPKILATWYG